MSFCQTGTQLSRPREWVLDGHKLRMHATIEVQCVGKVYIQNLSLVVCLSVQALTFLCGGPVVHSLNALLVVCAFRLL